MSRRKLQTQATVWTSLSQSDQQDEITAVQELARDLVAKVVEVVAERGMTCAHVQIAKFAVDVDKGEVVITSKGFASDDMLTDLAHAKGKIAKLTVLDAEQFNKKSTLLVADKDQPSLLGDDGDDQADHLSDDELYRRAVEIVRKERKCSTSHIQRALAIGYNKASRLVERMEVEKVVSAADHVGKREVLIGDGSASDDDIADISAEMDEAESAMDEPDDLHVESDAQKGGFASRMAGYAKERNPFDVNEDEQSSWSDWNDGWDAADRSDGAPEVDPDLGNTPVEDDPQDFPEVDEPVEVEGDQDPEPEDDQPAPEIEPEVEDEPEPEAEPDAENALADGQQARLKGSGKDENPFDGGTDGHTAWAEGWSSADGEIKQLVADGYKAGFGGKSKSDCPWKKSSDGERFWLEGFANGQADAKGR